jgi:Leucine-rich repeat (LRR) protein
LRAIDIQSLPNPEVIKTLYFNSCNLTSFDVSEMTGLEHLTCDNNQLTSIDLSHNANLKSCSFYLNQLLTIDLTGTQCSVISNGLQRISNMALAKLADGKPYIKLGRAGVASSVSNLNIWYGNDYSPTRFDNPVMDGEYLLLDRNGRTDISRVSYMFTATGNDSGAFINVEITIGDNYGIAIDPTNFPDENFRNYLLDQTYGTDALLTQEEIDGITYLDLQEMGINSLVGIQNLTALTFLNCSKNNLDNSDVDWINYLKNLKELWISNNPRITGFNGALNSKLEKIYCEECSLETLNVNGNTKLRNLLCSNNQLTTIEGLATLTELRSLVCDGNQFSTLDVRNSPFLTDLYCSKNNLTTLNLTQNQQLQRLQIYGNQLKASAMSAIANALPTRSTTYNMRAYYPELATEGNELSPTIVNALIEKGWNPQYTTNGTSWQDYAGATITYGLLLNGVEVTSDNCDNLTAINGVNGFLVKYDELANTLTLAYAEITGNSVGLENSIEGLTIVVEGSNTINILNSNAINLKANTTITGSSSSTLTATSDKNGIYIYAGTLTVKDGVTVYGRSNGETGYGIYGRKTSRQGIDGSLVTSYYGSLALEGSNTVVKGLGKTASIGNLKSLTRPSGTTIKVTDNSGTRPRQVDGLFANHCVYMVSGNTPTIATTLVTISCPRDGIGITTTNFPDEKLRNYLSGSSFDKDTDGWLTNDELEDITTLSLNNQGVGDLTGVTHLFALDRVYVNGNSLSTADFTGLNELRNIDIMDNSLTEDGIASMINSLPQGDGSTTTILIYHEGSENEHNFRPTMALTEAANAKGWRLMYQTADNHFKEFLPAIEINETNFPDENFRECVASYDTDEDGWLTYDELERITTLNIRNKGIEDFTGIQHFFALENLYADNNVLTTAYVEGLANLKRVDIQNNNLGEAGIITLLNTVPDGDGTNTILIYHEGSANEHNVEPNEHLIAVAHMRGWKLMYIKANGGYAEYKAGVEINQENFPDEQFRYLVKHYYDWDDDDFLLFSEARTITEMPFSGMTIEDFTGIEYFTELVTFNCSNNDLSTLDLTANTKLETLICNNNHLTSLTIGNCNSLRTLYIYNNQLDDMDMKNLFVKLPTCAEPGELRLEFKGSETEGNIVNLQRIATLKNTRNWTCYYSENGYLWQEYVTFITGDVNGDESVTIADVTALVNIILGKNEAPASGVADVNSDGGTTIADVTALVNIILGKE